MPTTCNKISDIPYCRAKCASNCLTCTCTCVNNSSKPNGTGLYLSLEATKFKSRWSMSYIPSWISWPHLWTACVVSSCRKGENSEWFKPKSNSWSCWLTIKLRVNVTTPSCNCFGHYGDWKIYLATEIMAKVANRQPTDLKKKKLGKEKC